MLSYAEYAKYDSLALAELVRTKKVTAQELLETALARSKAVNPTINAIVIDHEDVARKQLKDGLPNGPFTGVPFLLKDLGASLKGTVTTGGMRLMREAVADYDTTYVERIKHAGFTIFGKTHSPELGATTTSESRLFGKTRNPWDLERIAGGSSGGAAAAVAAGIIPLAHATDGGGSIRIPASCCGLFGLKPTRARTPSGPKRGEGWGGMSIGHCVSRSVRDSAALLDATAGPALGDPYYAPKQERPYLDEIKHAPGKLRIAVSTKTVNDAPVHPDVVAAVKDVAKLLESLGHHVEEATPALNGNEIVNAQGIVISANICAAVEEAAALHGRAPRADDVEKANWYRVERARTVDSSAYPKAMNVIHQVGRTLAEFMESYDVFLQPTVAQPPLPLGVVNLDREDLDGLFRDLMGFVPFTGLYNITGQPSMNVPLVWNGAGLPIGTMFTGRFGDEATLYRLAAQLEQARPWFDKRPTL
jgi:amidase